MGGVGRVGKVHRGRARLRRFEQGRKRVGQKGALPPGIGLAGHGRGLLVAKTGPVQQVRQARNRVADPKTGADPVHELAAVGVAGAPDFGAEFGHLPGVEFARVAGAFRCQHGRQSLPGVGVGVAVHARLVQAQILGNDRGRTPVAEHEQGRDRHVPRLPPAS